MIYKAGEADVHDVASLAVNMWDGQTVDELTETFSNVVRSDNSAIFILSLDSNANALHKAVGFAQCGLRFDYVEGTHSSPVGYLEGIYVEKPYRRQGYAKQLTEKCEQWAKEKGCREFASDCELDNEISLKFHLNAGFSESNRVICFNKQI